MIYFKCKDGDVRPYSTGSMELIKNLLNWQITWLKWHLRKTHLRDVILGYLKEGILED